MATVERSLDGNGPTERLRRAAERNAAEGRHVKACLLYEQLIANDSSPVLRYNCGDSYMARRRYEQALAHYRAAQIQPYLAARGHVAVARALVALDRADDALAELTKAAASGPRSAAIQTALGDVHGKRGDRVAAARHYEEATRLDQPPVAAWLGWAKVLEDGKVDEAFDKLMMALRVHPADATIHARLADLLPRVSERGAADRAIAGALAGVVESDRAQAHMRWGSALGHTGQRDAAFEQFLLALTMGTRLGPDDQSPIFDDMAAALDQASAGPRLARVAAVLDANADAPARRRWAGALTRNGLASAAIDQLELVLRGEPGNVATHDEILAALGNVELPEQATLVERIESVLESSRNAMAHASFVKTLLHLDLGDAADRHLAATRSLVASDLDHRAMHEAEAWRHRFRDESEAEAREWLAAARLGGDPKPLIEAMSPPSVPDALIEPVSALIASRAEPTVHAEWAEVLLRRHKSGAALQSIEAAAQHGLPADALADLVRRFMRERPDEDAGWETLARVVASREKEAPVLLAWADALSGRGRTGEAAEYFARVTELEPDNVLGWIGTAQGHVNRAEWGTAFDAYARSVEATPDDSWPYSAWLSGLERYQERDGVATRLKQAFGPGGPGLSSPVRWNDIRDAENPANAAFGRIVQALERNIDHDKGRVYFDCGATLFYPLRRFEEARRCFERAAKYLPDDVWARHALALSLDRLGDRRRAVAEFTAAVALQPQNFRVRIDRARTLSTSGEYKDACVAFREAFERDTDTDESTAEGRQARARALADWGLALTLAGEIEAAVAKARDAIALLPDDGWMWFRLAHSLGAAGRYEQATEAYTEAKRLLPGHPYAEHNIANDFATQGRHRRARETWNDVYDRYGAVLADALAGWDAEYCLNYGDICREVFSKYSLAETLLLAGRALDPDSPAIHIALTRLHLEAKRALERTPPGAESWDGDVPDRKVRHGAAAAEAYVTALHLLSRHRVTSGPSPEPADSATLLTLGDLYLLMEEPEKAEPAFREAVARQPTSARALLGFGNALTALRRYDDAARAFRSALALGGDDHSIRTSLARALLKAGALEAAEKEFQAVLARTRFHVDAHIGLAELHLDVAARPAAERESAEREDRYRRAIRALATAIDVAGSPDRPIGVDGPSASAYYLSGYAKIKLWETRRVGRDRRLVQEALRDFRTCHALDPRHIKAAQAIERIQEERALVRSRSERLVPALIIFVATLMLVVAHVGFLVGLPRQAERVALTARSFEGLLANGVDEATLKPLRQIQDVRFAGDEALLARSSVLLGKQFPALRPVLLAHAMRTDRVVELGRLDATAYSLLTFGALVFLVAGAYLPQLTSLKFPGLQLEKTSIDRVETSYSVGISREEGGPRGVGG